MVEKRTLIVELYPEEFAKLAAMCAKFEAEPCNLARALILNYIATYERLKGETKNAE